MPFPFVDHVSHRFSVFVKAISFDLSGMFVTHAIRFTVGRKRFQQSQCHKAAKCSGDKRWKKS